MTPLIPMSAEVQAAFRQEFVQLLSRYGYASGAAILLGEVTEQKHGLPIKGFAVECLDSHQGPPVPHMQFHHLVIEGAVIGVQTAIETYREEALRCTCPACMSRN